MRVITYDIAYPSEIATSTVDITVSRNENSPVFSAAVYRVTINETTNVGETILSVLATDADGVRSKTDSLLFFFNEIEICDTK